MFSGYAFDTDALGIGNITGWNTSCITDMQYMFTESTFNQNINLWDVSKVTNMYRMFYGAYAFNQPLDKPIEF
jgi:starvation-inducible outer membrane lipoprotein